MKITKTYIKSLNSTQIEELILSLKEELENKKKEENLLNDIFNKISESGINPKRVAEFFNKPKNEKKQKNYKSYKLIVEGEEKIYKGYGKKPQWLINYINNGGNISDIEC